MRFTFEIGGKQEVTLEISPNDTLRVLQERFLEASHIPRERQQWYCGEFKLTELDIPLSALGFDDSTLIYLVEAQPEENLLTVADIQETTTLTPLQQGAVIQFINQRWNSLAPQIKQNEETRMQAAKAFKSYVADPSKANQSMPDYLQCFTLGPARIQELVGNPNQDENLHVEIKLFYQKALLRAAEKLISPKQPPVKRRRIEEPVATSSPMTSATVTVNSQSIQPSPSPEPNYASFDLGSVIKIPLTTSSSIVEPLQALAWVPNQILPWFRNKVDTWVNQFSSSSSSESQSPCYIFIDLNPWICEQMPTADDLILSNDSQPPRVLQQGKVGIAILNKLQEYGYQLALHSKVTDLSLLDKLTKACQAVEFTVPKVAAMAIYDNVNYLLVNSGSPKIIEREAKYIYWGADNENDKSSGRRALEKALNISAENRKQHVVLDTDLSVIEAAQREGYKAKHIDTSNSLISALRNISDMAAESHSNKKRRRS